MENPTKLGNAPSIMVPEFFLRDIFTTLSRYFHYELLTNNYESRFYECEHIHKHVNVITIALKYL